MSELVERLHYETVKLREKAKEGASSEHQPSGMMIGLLANAVAQNYEEAADHIEELEERVRELEAENAELKDRLALKQNVIESLHSSLYGPRF